MSTRDSQTPPPPSFEQSIARLEEIIARIDHPETGLEETIALTAEGNRLIRNSRKLLAQAELKIRTLADTQQDDTPAPLASSSTQKNATTASQKTAPSAPDDHGFSLF